MARRVRLEDLTFTFRCQESWSDMEGQDAVRHCGSCDKDVFDLSVLPRADAEELLRSTQGKICVRLYRTADGRVITADEAPTASRPVATCGSFTSARLKPRRRELWRRLSTGAAAAAVVLQPGSCETSSTTNDVGEPGTNWPHMQVPEIFPMMGAPMMGEVEYEPEPQRLMGRIAIAPLEVAPEQPVELTLVPMVEMLGEVATID